MSTPRLLALLLAAIGPQAHAAGDVDVASFTGLPRVSRVDGQSLAWRPLTVRADVANLRLEAKVPTCLDTTVERTARSAERMGLPAGPCDLKGDDAARRSLSRQWKATMPWSVPVRGGPELLVSYRAWSSGLLRHGSLVSTSSGSEAELELAQRLGAVRVAAGYAKPVLSSDPLDRWSSRHVSASWTVTPRHVLELSWEAAREQTFGDRDRIASLRYTSNDTRTARWWAGLTRQLDVPSEPLRVGFGMDWRF